MHIMLTEREREREIEGPTLDIMREGLVAYSR